MIYTVASWEDVLKGKIENYIDSISILKNAVEARANSVMPSESMGGLTPEQNQYAEIGLQPRMFTGVDGNILKTFRQYLDPSKGTDTDGWLQIMKADPSEAGELGKKYVFGVLGLVIPDPTLLTTEIQMKCGDYTFPRINIEEFVDKTPIAILFNLKKSNANRFVFDPNNSFRLAAYVETAGYQRIKPLGIAEVPKPTAISSPLGW